jgi:hypothetical protein
VDPVRSNEQSCDEDERDDQEPSRSHMFDALQPRNHHWQMWAEEYTETDPE